MNARQKMKNLKKKMNKLQSNNDFMRRIIANSPTMQELYDAYNKPLNITQTTMQFQEYRAKRIIPKYTIDTVGLMPTYTTDVKELIEYTKQALVKDLFEGIKDHITYEVDNEYSVPSITASIFVGIK